MADEKLRVAIIGCGRMGQHYTDVYNTFENTEVVAIAEYNDDRRNVVGERFGVKALFKDAEEMYQKMDEVPDLAAVVLPGKFIKDAVIASAQAGVRGVSTDKPIGARLSDVDEMIATCEERGVVFHGGNLQRSRADVQEAASWLRRGDYGEVQGRNRPLVGRRDIGRRMPAHRRPPAPHERRDHRGDRLGQAAGLPGGE